MPYTRAYGKNIEHNNSTLLIHVAQYGIAGSGFIMNQDLPDDGSDTSIYYSSPAFSSQASPITINGVVQYGQCVYSKKSNGENRKDFIPRLFNLNELFAVLSSDFNNKPFFILNGYYGNQLRSLDAGGSASNSIGQGQGLTVFNQYGFLGGGNKDFEIENLIFAQSYEGFFSRTNIRKFNNVFVSLINLRSSSGDLATLKVETSIIKDTTLLNSGQGQSEGRYILDTILLNLTKNIFNVSPSQRNYLKQSSAVFTFDTLDYSNNQSQSTSIQTNNISDDPKLNAEILDDFSNEVDSPNARKGAINSGKNIVMHYGETLYRGDAPFNGGTISDVVDSSKLSSYVKGTNTYYTSLDTDINLKNIKWIGGEKLTSSWGLPDLNFVMSAPSCGVDYERKSGKPVCYLRVTYLDGQSAQIVADNDLPQTIDNIDTTNFFPLKMVVGANWDEETTLYVDNTGKVVLTAVNPDSTEPSNISDLTPENLYDILFESGFKEYRYEFLVYYHDLTDFDNFIGLTAMAKQDELEFLKTDTDKPQYSDTSTITYNDGKDNAILPLNSINQELSSLTVPFGYTNKYTTSILNSNIQAEGQNYEIVNFETKLEQQ